MTETSTKKNQLILKLEHITPVIEEGNDEYDTRLALFTYEKIDNINRISDVDMGNINRTSDVDIDNIDLENYSNEIILLTNTSHFNDIVRGDGTKICVLNEKTLKEADKKFYAVIQKKEQDIAVFNKTGFKYEKGDIRLRGRIDKIKHSIDATTQEAYNKSVTINFEIVKIIPNEQTAGSVIHKSRRSRKSRKSRKVSKKSRKSRRNRRR